MAIFPPSFLSIYFHSASSWANPLGNRNCILSSLLLYPWFRQSFNQDRQKTKEKKTKTFYFQGNGFSVPGSSCLFITAKCSKTAEYSVQEATSIPVLYLLFLNWGPQCLLHRALHQWNDMFRNLYVWRRKESPPVCQKKQKTKTRTRNTLGRSQLLFHICCGAYENKYLFVGHLYELVCKTNSTISLARN